MVPSGGLCAPSLQLPAVCKCSRGLRRSVLSNQRPVRHGRSPGASEVAAPASHGAHASSDPAALLCLALKWHDCTSLQVCFTLDQSGSITSTGWTSARSFVAKVITGLARQTGGHSSCARMPAPCSIGSARRVSAEARASHLRFTNPLASQVLSRQVRLEDPGNHREADNQCCEG